MALKPYVVNVTLTGGTDRVSQSPIWCHAVTFQLDDAAAATAYVGPSTLAGASTAFQSLTNGQQVTLDAAVFMGKLGETFNLQDFYVKGTAADIVHVFYWRREE